MASLPEILDLLRRGALLLTPNLRSARQWQARLAADHGSGFSFSGSAPSAFHLPHSQPPSGNSVLPWRAWTHSLWQQALLQGATSRVLLGDVQTEALWEQVFHHSRPATLRPLRSIVRLCAGAGNLLYTHLAADRLLTARGLDTPIGDAAHFTAWFRDFQNICQTESLLPSAALEDALTHRPVIEALRPTLAPSYIVFGFDRLLPAQKALLAAVEASGSTVLFVATADFVEAERLRLAPAAGKPQPSLLRCPDIQQEWDAVASWLRQTLAQGTQECASPLLSVVIPDLAESRNALERVLREHLAPSLRDVSAPDPAPLWEFSSGRPLASLPVVRDALRLLHWTQKPLPDEDVSELLRSPYLFLGLPSNRASEIDALLLRDSHRLRPEWTLGTLSERCRKGDPRFAPELCTPLCATLDALASSARSLERARRGYAEWTDTVSDLLHTARWPGPRDRNSMEFQATESWIATLERLASLDLLGSRILFSEFLQRLQELAEETEFAPENTGAPIQIVTVPESAGSTFDRIWFAHADETHWASRRSAHPLLPFALQRSVGMPGTDPAQDAEEDAAAARRIAGSTLAATATPAPTATEVIFSYPAVDADGDLRPSAAVRSLPGIQVAAAANPVPSSAGPLALEQFQDTGPIPPLPPGSVPGGASILRSQAACAFRAFAEHRLFSREIEAAGFGFKESDRGTIVHRILELFWKEVQTQAELKKLLGDGTLESVLQFHIDSVLPSAPASDSWARRYLSIHRRRLLHLLSGWLEYEAQRPPFKVHRSEHKVKGARIGPLQFDLRVDRVDHVSIDLGDGMTEEGLLLIDYKTGNVDPRSWQGERPDEPQLPLYAAAAGLPGVAAIAFATLRPGKDNLSLKGLPVGSPLLPPSRSRSQESRDFETLVEDWRETLERLATDFAEGSADVGPKEYPKTCTWCAQRMLCRLNPDLLEEMADEEEGGEIE